MKTPKGHMNVPQLLIEQQTGKKISMIDCGKAFKPSTTLLMVKARIFNGDRISIPRLGTCMNC